MRRIPFEFGTIHFVGIGGIGMSGIAEVMHNLGYSVRGSDVAEGANVIRLGRLGIDVVVGHRADNVAGADAIVISSAIKPDNVEVVEARKARIPVVRRADMLAELMRLKWCVSIAGTHGKTTTTSMVGTLLETAGLDPTVINGGIVNAYGTNARLGKGDWMVVEADESDGSFVKLPATIAVITNIDPEHLDFYGDFDAEKKAFLNFAEKVPFYGVVVMCVDHPEVQALLPHIIDRRVVTYGFSPQADVRAENIRASGIGVKFDIHFADDERLIRDIELPMPGEHNVLNATAAIAVGREMDIAEDFLKRAFVSFKGVKRRFTRVGSGAGIEVIDDYGHHPVEIEAVLKAAREICNGKLVAVMQPHRFSRLSDLFEEFCVAFNDADVVIIVPVYAAGEDPIEGVDHHSLAEGMRARGHKHVLVIEDETGLASSVKGCAGAGDMCVCLGAGNITAWANALPGQLSVLDRKEAAS